MKTFFKSLVSRVPGESRWLLICFVILAFIGAWVADRAITQGMNVSLTVASFMTFSATAPAPQAAQPHLEGGNALSPSQPTK